ncbi:MAG: ABC transporter ATP-binding protein [Candidatus Doudnabacteria bacterium]
MKLLWNYLKNFKLLLAGALVLATINQVFSLLDPQIFRLLIDRYANRIGELSRTEFIHGIIWLLLATMLVALISRIAKSLQDYYANVITQKLGAKLYNDSVTHSFSLPFSTFEDQRSGEFLSKLKDARNDSQKLIQLSINIMFFTTVGIIFVLIYAFFVHWAIGLVYALMIPSLAWITFYITKKIRTAQTQIVKQTQSLAGSTTETLRNVELVKSLGLESQEIKHLNNTNEEILQLELQKTKLIRTYGFVQGTMINALRMCLMFLMLWLVYEKSISLGEFFTLMFYSFFIFNPLSAVGEVATSYQETRASLEKLEEILELPAEEKPTSPQTISDLKTITFDNVSFAYPSGQSNALSNLSLTINAGKTIAFVGPSGSGKSTTVKAIVGLYRPSQGRILYNDTAHDQVDFESLRKQVGLVAQDTQLFSGSIRENLLFVKPDATDKQCLEVLQAASAQSLLERTKQGLDTIIGEGGLKLSGGERQRLAIARALLREPKILIFDEATSSLDSITEDQITQTIKKVEQANTDLIRIIIAHRLSTIVHADQIFVLEKGELVEQGTHQNLLEQKGLYWALWRQQSAE